MKTKHFKKQSLRKNCRWLLWIVGFIFFQGACSKGTRLTEKEQEQFKGLYACTTTYRLLMSHIVTDASTGIMMIKLAGSPFEFHPVKLQDSTLKRFSNSLTAKYYLKDESNQNKLVVMSDGSIHFYQGDHLNNIFYKISNDIDEVQIQILYDAINKIDTQTIIDNFKETKFDEIANNIDSLLEKIPETLSQNRYRRIPINIDDDLHPNIPKQTSETNLNDINNQSDPKVVAIITGFIIFIIVVICICVKCYQNQEEPNATEHLQVETNDISYHYPAPTDIVLDVKEMENKQSILENMKQSDSISSVSEDDTKTSSTNLLTTETIDSEEPTSMQSMKTNSTQSIFSFSSVPTADIEKTSTNFDPLELVDSEVKEPKAAQSELTEISDEKLSIS